MDFTFEFHKWNYGCEESLSTPMLRPGKYGYIYIAYCIRILGKIPNDHIRSESYFRFVFNLDFWDVIFCGMHSRQLENMGLVCVFLILEVFKYGLRQPENTFTYLIDQSFRAVFFLKLS